MLGVTFFAMKIGFVLMVAGWVMMLMFLQKHPLPPAQTPVDAFGRWRQFMKGDGFPAEAEPRRKLISTMFMAALGLFAVAILAFIIAGGPSALPPAPQP